jgi:hypothetical protein
MMGQQTGDQRQPFYLFNLEQRIPARAGILRPAIMSVTPSSFTAAFMIVIVTRSRGDVAFDLLRDFDDLTLTAEARQYLDEAVQEDIARHEKEKKKQHRRTSQGVLVPLRDVAGLWETPQVSERWKRNRFLVCCLRDGDGRGNLYPLSFRKSACSRSPPAFSPALPRHRNL